MSRSQTDP